MKFKSILVIIPILFTGFTTVERDLKTEYYYNLKFLKFSSSPRKVKMVRTGNLSGGGKLISKGVLFSYKNRAARKVSISGNFSNWKLNRMSRSKNGIWFYYLDNFKRKIEIKYKFMVDGIWIMDPENPDRADDGIGSYVSVVTPISSSEGTHVTYKIMEKNLIEFRIYWPRARFVSIVGDFNHWNPENDLLRKGEDGIWRLKKRLPPGIYRYKYIVDGKWIPDTYNERSASDDIGKICSVIEVK